MADFQEQTGTSSHRRKQNSCTLGGMVDIDLIVQTLRDHGHTVEDVHVVPPNAGEYAMTVDGNAVNLEGARHILELDEAK